MIINKDLKNISFQYSEEDKSFTIIDTKDGAAVELNKVESFAFMRFLVRVSQRNWLRKKPAQKKSAAENDWPEVNINPEQLEMLITDNE